jgi:protein SCO1
MRSRILAGVAAIAAVLAAGSVSAAAQNARWGADYFPNVTLTTADGTTVRFYDDLIKGKLVAINLIYTTCTYACPLETARLAQVQKVLGDRMGRDVFFYSITIDPEHDTPAVLKTYAEKFHAGPGWLFLTGSQADIALISRKLGLYAPRDPSDPDGHLPALLVGNEVTGQWMRNSGLDNPRFLARTIGDWLTSWQGPKRELKSYADAAPLALDRGEYTFKSHCAACHTLGRGEHIGPDLLGVTKARGRVWLARFILAPDEMLAAGDPIAKELAGEYQDVRMPNLALSPGDVAAIIEYLAKQDAATSITAATATRAANAVGAAATPIIGPYLRIQEALSADSLAGARQAARRLVSAATIGASPASIRSAAGRFEQTDLNSARAAFATLSDAIITFAQLSGLGAGDDVHLAYCPMAHKYWLQRGTAVRNPYYGKRMIDCGRLTTIGFTDGQGSGRR